MKRSNITRKPLPSSVLVNLEAEEKVKKQTRYPKKLENLLFLILVGILTSGCSEKMFQPPPPDFLEWIAPNSSIVDVKKKLLECGMPEPSGKSPEYQQLGRNAQVSISLCMVNAGFSDKDEYPLCKYEKDRVLPVCASGAEIPTPDINRRLNSHYCRTKSNYQYCKQNARFPELCDKNDYVNPRPECLP
ncbi:hypothetical protein [Acinetobacter guillouiae]|uniref:hypothetical protein n=1 Tax=Acinetobacter guillouiae TaxID=106649 RepID=UPI0026E22AE6|nr:hypothetical protein [Acinetobacter guillouiae]MDO6645369.1 hypothetical protein [Acinetobacter guillouiae]